MTTTLEPPRTASPAKDGLVWTPHPMVDAVEDGRWRALADEEIAALLREGHGESDIEQYWRDRERRIALSVSDPLSHGFELAFWADVRALLARKDEVYALGGNNPGKTELGGKLASENLCAGMSRKVLCVTLNDDYSKLQQAAVYKYLPPTARGLNERKGPRPRDWVKNVTYSQKGGFTDNTFVLPNRSQCWFKTVEQYLRNETSFEGPQYDFVWLDEPVPISLLNTLKFRAGKLGGKIFHTFTAVNGYDATCKNVLDGARLLKSLPMNWAWRPDGSGEGAPDPDIKIPVLKMDEVQLKGLPAGHMPYMMQPIDPAQGVIFLWTHWNPFQPRSKIDPKLPAITDKTRGKSKETVRMRLFGWSEKLVGCQFPAFKPEIHVLPPEKCPAAKDSTLYMSCDPRPAKTYFILWARVDRLGRIFIVKESPDLGEGAWVTEDGVYGDGERVYEGRGTDFYKGYIRAREVELGGVSLRRFGDPRAFATEAASREGGKNLFNLFESEDESDPGNADKQPMYFEPAKVQRAVRYETEVINDKFSIPHPEQPISIENEPKLFISEDCQNLIRAIVNWKPKLTESGLTKDGEDPHNDPIDALRYLFGEPLYFSDPEVPEVQGGRGWRAGR